MAKKVLYTNFEGVDEIVSQLLADNNVLKKAITRNNLFKFWKRIVGEKFQNNSRPYSMTSGQVMVVACKNSAVAQELMLRKTKILKDFEPYLTSLKIKVKDLRFDVKRWVEETEE